MVTIQELELHLKSVIATISNMESIPARNWTDDHQTHYISLCNKCGDMMDAYADYCDNNASFNNKINY